MLIDTHCHLDFPDFDKDRKEVLVRAEDAGVKYLINIASDYASNLKSLELASTYPQIYTALGIHPHYAANVDEDKLNKIRQLASKEEKVVAIGEIGLDFYKNLSPQEVQIKMFKNFLNISLDLSHPAVIHCRNAHREMLEILKEGQFTSRLKGVFHCFSADKDFLEEVIKMGFYVSFTANITYPDAHNIREIVKQAPIERILLETDCPFLPPQDKRGLRNEPAFMTSLVKTLAELKGFREEDIARISSFNAHQLFKLPSEEGAPKIAYPIRDSLYLNITNRCTNNCSFCVRFVTDYVKGHNLRLKEEPTVEEIIKEIKEIEKYKEVVFCGYGEPLLRLDVVREIAGFLKEKGAHLRLNTNGQGNLIHKRNIVSELKGLIDEVSVSLNVDSEENYNKICQPQFGQGTFGKIKEFILECKRYIPKISVTFIDLPPVNIEECRRLAKEELGVEFRIRQLHHVG